MSDVVIRWPELRHWVYGVVLARDQATRSLQNNEVWVIGQEPRIEEHQGYGKTFAQTLCFPRRRYRHSRVSLGFH
jgi:hypothetical protein